MDLIIRPVRIEDAEDLNFMRRQEGVRENITGLTSERLQFQKDFINSLSRNDHMFVAETDGKVVGIVGLHVSNNLRIRHKGGIGIMVRKEYQNKGIGRKLLEEIIDLADNWIMLIRLELEVLVTNERAIKLYKSLGFEIEGESKYAIVQNGKYVNEYKMARYNISKQKF